MPPPLTIQHVPSSALTKKQTRAVRELCDAAYETDTKPMFAALGEGDHLLGIRDDVLVSHLMWVTRWLEPEGLRPLKTAYVEMVATAADSRRKGYATTLLDHFVPLVGDYELAALCPAAEGIYLRLGWLFWLGPLSARKGQKLIPTPEERVMIMPLPRTPALDMHVPLSVEWRAGEVW